MANWPARGPKTTCDLSERFERLAEFLPLQIKHEISPHTCPSVQKKLFSTSRALESNRLVTLIPGDGIGVEIAQSVKQIFAVAKVSLCVLTTPSCMLEHMRTTRVAFGGLRATLVKIACRRRLTGRRWM